MLSLSPKERFFALSHTFQPFHIPSSITGFSIYIPNPSLHFHCLPSLTFPPFRPRNIRRSLGLHAFALKMPKPRVIEIQVRMDCNGCVQKIKKALHGVNGICELYIDFPQQKITVIGWADPESIAKAIKKTRKTAIICSHTEPPDDPEGEPQDSAAQGDGSAQEPSANPNPNPSPQQEPANPTQTEGEAAQPAEPPRDPPPPPPPPPPEKPKPENPPPQEPAEGSSGKMTHTPFPRDVEEVHVIYHHQPDYGYRYNHGYTGQWNSYPTSPEFEPQPPQPVYVTHSYNTYRASPYVTGYDYVRPQAAPPAPAPQYAEYTRVPPPEQVHYSRPPPAPQYRAAPPPPPEEYTHYSRAAQAAPPPPMTQYADYSRAAPPEYTHYSRAAPPTPLYTNYSYSRPASYSEDYHYGNSGNGNITSVFSDENPNACRIV